MDKSLRKSMMDDVNSDNKAKIAFNAGIQGILQRKIGKIQNGFDTHIIVGYGATQADAERLVSCVYLGYNQDNGTFYVNGNDDMEKAQWISIIDNRNSDGKIVHSFQNREPEIDQPKNAEEPVLKPGYYGLDFKQSNLKLNKGKSDYMDINVPTQVFISKNKNLFKDDNNMHSQQYNNKIDKFRDDYADMNASTMMFYDKNKHRFNDKKNNNTNNINNVNNSINIINNNINNIDNENANIITAEQASAIQSKLLHNQFVSPEEEQKLTEYVSKLSLEDAGGYQQQEF